MPEGYVRVNVRAIAEYYYERGDLVTGGAMAARMLEGVRGHQMVQAAYPAGYAAEVPVRLDYGEGEPPLAIFGRIDGLLLGEGQCLIEEIKTSAREVARIGEDDDPAHWAQAQLYGAMLACREDLPAVTIRLVYVNLSGGRVSFTRTYARAALMEMLRTYAGAYQAWLRALAAWRAQSLPSMRALAFPYAEFRAGQRQMAANVYVALRDGKRLLCEAPTGSGKTVAALFPALKALGEARIDRVFYLTARTTGAQAAADALARMARAGLRVRRVQLTAKEKICPQAEVDCHPLACARARGYYDRRRAALYEALTLEALDRPGIEELADRHCLCPFELSLDACEIADVIVCDYNYLFDPAVRLRRFFMGRADCGVLIDEAHQLPGRARDMLSAALEAGRLMQLRRRIGAECGRKDALYRLLSRLLREMRALAAAEAPTEVPEALRMACAEFCEGADARLGEEAPWQDALRDAYFGAIDFLRVAEAFDEDYKVLVGGASRLPAIRLYCLDAAKHIGRTLGRVHGAALFSATLTPLPFYRDLLGLSEEAGDALMRLAPPYPPENLLVACAPIATRYARREASLWEVARMICALVAAKVGNYMICFPSYAYLHAALEPCRELLPAAEWLAQAPSMDDWQRADFLARFVEAPTRTLAALTVMGGVFAEAIDLPGDRLVGVAVVGVGVPQICAENDALRALYEARFSAGYQYAYMYPGLARVMQAAGRLIRSQTDRGALLLIDERWLSAQYRDLVPAHWRMQVIRQPAALLRALGAFEREGRDA